MVRRRRRKGLGNISCSTSKFYVNRVHLDSGGYDGRGRYFGRGEPLFVYDNLDNSDGYLRAKDRNAAKAQILAKCPGAKFHR